MIKLIHWALWVGLFLGETLYSKVPEGYLGTMFPDLRNQSEKNNVYVESQLKPEHNALSAVAVFDRYIQAVHDEMVCRQVFQMTMAQKEQMKKLSYDDFVVALLRRDDLCDEAAMALWDEYKKKRWWDWSNEKSENERKLKDGLEKRRRDREQKQQRQQQQEIVRIQSESKKYNPKILQSLDYISPLTQSYAQRQVGDATVYAALDHFCNPELGLIKCKKTGDMVLNISGGHLYGVCESIERAGFVKIKEVVTLPSGALHYFMEDVFTGRILEKTVVPRSWDAKKLCNAAWELYEGPGIVKEALHGFKKTGFVDGIEFEMYYSVNKDATLVMHKIITCYAVA